MKSSIIRQIEKLQKIDEERNDQLTKLMRLVVIKEIYPTAFNHGRVKTYLKGDPWNGFIFVIERSNHTKKEWPIVDVPRMLVYAPLEKIKVHYHSRGDMRAVVKINGLLGRL